MAKVAEKGVKMKAKWAYGELSKELKENLRDEFINEYGCSRASFYNWIANSDFNESQKKWLTIKLGELLNERNLILIFN